MEIIVVFLGILFLFLLAFLSTKLDTIFESDKNYNPYRWILDSNKRRGRSGENQVISVLNNIGCRHVSNLVLIDNRNKSHQIDHVVILPNGIFCIETKNYSGRIYGRENDVNWTQVFKTGMKNKFYNPIKQNKSHIYNLRCILGHNYEIYSVIVFTQDNVNNVHLDNVIGISYLQRYLINFNNGIENYSVEEMNNIYTKLISNHRDISEEEHIKNIKELRENIENKICPRCGRELNLKNGKYGNFYGCKGYPKCKFTMKA